MEKGCPVQDRGDKGLPKLILAPSLAYKAAVEQTLNNIVPNSTDQCCPLPGALKKSQ